MNFENISQIIIKTFNSIPQPLINYFGYLIIFLSAIFESIPIFGSLFPGQTLIILSGFLAYQNLMNLTLLIIIVSIGAIIGDIISFEIGKKQGKKFLKKYGKYILIDEKRNQKIKKLINKNLGKTIFLGRYNSFSRAFVPFIAGSININRKKFLFWNIITGIIWGITWVLVGYFAGKSFEIISKYISLGILILTLIIIFSWIFIKFYDKKKHIFTKYQINLLSLNSFFLIIIILIINNLFNNSTLFYIDNWINSKITLLWNNITINIFKIITFLGDSLAIIIISIIIFIYLYKKKDKFDSYFYLLNITIGIISVFSIKNIIQRIRPESHLLTLKDFSFPSGHTTFATIIAFSIFLIYYDLYKKTPKIKYLFLILLYPIIIGFSRIYLNVHWFSDVIAGFSLGIFIVTGNYIILNLIKKKKKNNS
jgi:undecaprenyl-diphosphatase